MKKKIAHNEYRPHFRFFKSAGSFPFNLCMGYELEVQSRNKYEGRFQAEQIINQYPWLYAKDEADINGCEINTHPFNWNWWLKNKAVGYIKNVKETKLYPDRKCGFHIHLSRSWFSRQHLIRMTKLFYANPRFIEHVSQRVKARWARNWTMLKIAANPWIAEEMMRCSTDSSDSILKTKDFNNSKLCKDVVDGIYEERNVALNFCNRTTIEIRIFQSTLNPKLIQAYLEFALACAMYTKNIRFQDVSIDGLKRFANSSRFPNLRRSGLMSSCRYSWRG